MAWQETVTAYGVLSDDTQVRELHFTHMDATCVEVCFHGELVSVRDSKALNFHTHGQGAVPTITVTATEWASFIAAVRDREFASLA